MARTEQVATKVVEKKKKLQMAKVYLLSIANKTSGISL